ncbi:zeta toxin family protein [Rivularia sp. PCC 7116]|uniref:zeta toxin family protein n=1 Tax=Rivularia sp. PCC 7116 TaxID=373994 RepID=UPI0002D64606|nr:AAA family ATPase [Rivularia sp. PCC 7116]
MTCTIVIINGAPGVGKSTTAKLLAQSSQNSVCIRGDNIKHWIVNVGWVKHDFQLRVVTTIFINRAVTQHYYLEF